MDIRRDTGVVGESRDHTDAARRGMLREAVEPVIGDFRIGLEDDRIAIAMEAAER